MLDRMEMSLLSYDGLVLFVNLDLTSNPSVSIPRATCTIPETKQ